ncbi:DNA-binding NarL/FixJ family response regulator [Paenibacillus sp. V4I3]|uniref:Helix-turn-helix transcriptional regulator n=1 Tax=Paenibacillus alginolyticus TaxID=59839 RepID=A0ABT4G8V0_9BACL|nr:MULTISPECIES: helix-turn-helix transcriptional regulator [Paenibacillus]MCY9664560.1 helix-turn-helix transcriptional regulator [Paenibacillus alginolyticus]MCY9692606.1 helix-turn-helix transcriptional regulator [Paenibacillus alginolyticus]MDQ0873187.1 DNA-binding NarL/FixJ family response regulator [Paenibacillus sp. V4I3]MEC0143813.1 helix-turn-helix transcriptional regulator [Paenibacillus alginolyticus]NRF90556.1 helix-turn-helix transcriptional regulator [Paenibacillus frigoriresiste
MTNRLITEHESYVNVELTKEPELVFHQFFANYGLTQRESEILSLLVTHGYTNREIAESCYISEKTVKIHLANIMSKIGIGSMRKLLAMLLQQALTLSNRTNESSRITTIGMS